MKSKILHLTLISALLIGACGKTDSPDASEPSNESASMAQNQTAPRKTDTLKAKPKEPVPVDVAVERALKKMNPEQKKTLNETPLTAKRYPPSPEPNFGPKNGSIRFTDTDPGPTIGGILTMEPAVDENGQRVDEVANGITSYSIHWGLEVASPGIEDDKGNGDLGGDCMNFRDPSYIVKTPASASLDLLSWEIPFGTVVPENAVYFVGLTQYGATYNLKKCTQIPIENLIEQ